MEVKRFGTFPVILVKLATPPLPPQTKLNFEQNAESFAVGGRREEPKTDPKIVIRSRVL